MTAGLRVTGDYGSEGPVEMVYEHTDGEVCGIDLTAMCPVAAEALVAAVRCAVPASRIELLDLRPGDVVIATVPDRTTDQHGHALRSQLEAKFPGHSVVIKTENVHLQFARDQS